MTENTAAAPAPQTLEQLEERVRQRLVHNGQHGALAEFGQYTAEVHTLLQAVPRIGREHPIATAAEPATTKPAKPKRATKAKSK